MSWSVSAAAPRDEAIQQVRDQLRNTKKNYLMAPAESGRADRILDTIERFAKDSVAPTDVLKISAWGSESTIAGGTDEPGRIVAIQGGYNVTVERPAPTEPTAAAAA